MQLRDIDLHYGGKEPLTLAFDGDRFRSFHGGPAGLADLGAAVCSALTNPNDFPPLSAICIPDDRVTIVLDRDLPGAGAIAKEVTNEFAAAGVTPEQLTILQPAPTPGRLLPDPRGELAEPIRSAITWKVHDASDVDNVGYLASSVSGERIYLARELLDADLVLPIYAAGFDSVLGYRSPGNLMYPGLSNAAAIEKYRGEGHRELRPEDDRPLRQLGEEICWMLGTQFAVGVAAGGASESAAAVFGGQWEAVQREARRFVDHAWKVSLSHRAETVVLSVSGPAETVGWEEIGAALAVARDLVIRDGRIIVLSSVQAPLGPGLEMLRASRSAKTALQLLRKESPPDLVPATQIAAAADWANVSLLSRLEESLVEELLLAPLSSAVEAERLIALTDDVVLINRGDQVHGEIVAD